MDMMIASQFDYRIFWAVAMAACLVGSSLLIFEMTMKVKEDPIITYLSSVPVQVVDVSSVKLINERFLSKTSHFRFLSLLLRIVLT